ncbi:MAG TPA: hypothetical protein VK508_16420 [Cyclobacteriaceae bacterium]|nr:hypothetical protein [Cyclobacteriaceae bacterium]
MKKRKGLEHDPERQPAQDVVTEDNPVVDELVSDAPRAMISQRLLEQFERFYEYHPARRLSRNLRSMLLEFLMYDGSAEAEYLRDLMIDLDGLFTLLDAMEEEAERPVGQLNG